MKVKINLLFKKFYFLLCLLCLAIPLFCAANSEGVAFDHDQNYETVQLAQSSQQTSLNAACALAYLCVSVLTYEDLHPEEKPYIDTLISYLSQHSSLRLYSRDAGLLRLFYRFAIKHQNYDLLRCLIQTIDHCYENYFLDHEMHQHIITFISDTLSPTARDVDLYHTAEEREAYLYFIQGISMNSWHVLGSWFLGRRLESLEPPRLASDHFDQAAFQVFKKVAFCTSFERLTDEEVNNIEMTIDLFPEVSARQIRGWMRE